MKTTSKTSDRRRGFSLIEILVVIAIMALLMDILLPSLQSARAQAKSLVCLTRLRELSHGWHLYADDYNDVCLPGRFAGEPGGISNPRNWYDVGNGLKYRPRWVATMGKYVGIYAFDRPSTEDDRQDYENEVYHCPEAPEWVDERNYAYGYNHLFLGNPRRTNGRFHNFPVVRSRIRSFAGTVLGGDCLGTAAGIAQSDRAPYDNSGTDYAGLGNHGWTLDPPRLTPTSDRGSGDADSPRTAVDPRHKTKANVVYCDGHAESQSTQALGYRLLPEGRYVDLETVEDPPVNYLFSGTGRDDAPPDIPQ